MKRVLFLLALLPLWGAWYLGGREALSPWLGSLGFFAAFGYVFYALWHEPLQPDAPWSPKANTFFLMTLACQLGWLWPVVQYLAGALPSTLAEMAIGCLILCQCLGLALFWPPLKGSLPALQQQSLGLSVLLGFNAFSLCAPFLLRLFAQGPLVQGGGGWSALYQAEGKVAWPLGVFLVFLRLQKSRLTAKRYQATQEVTTTSGVFGTARFLSETELAQKGFFTPQTGLFSGVSLPHRKPLYLPLTNRLILAPPGAWKSSTTSIPALLSYEGPIFALDIKGELWAVTARYRAEVLKRQVVVFDPFGITKTPAYAANKPKALLKTWTFNPFDSIPDEPLQQERFLNAMTNALVVEEGQHVRHFDDNAKILLRGYLDYVLHQPKPYRDLLYLYELASEPEEQAKHTYREMQKIGGRAAAAASQILRVGSDERGSILSTTYRQLDWLGDKNLQHLLGESNVQLTDFLSGGLDIYVVLPEDQVKTHNRLVRLLLALLMSLLVQASPDTLPRQKMLFLLDEVAQLGYSPDIEQCIEVLRARGVVVWTIFQSLSQIEHYQKPDLLKGATIKQIFTQDDTKTMEWVQTLAAKTTVKTKTDSHNQGSSRPKMQLLGGAYSTGTGESVQETAVDLLPLNRIRELPLNEQWIFLQGEAPIHAYKVRYFENPWLEGRYDANPLEIPR